MNTSSISNVASVLSSALQGAGLSPNTAGNSVGGVSRQRSASSQLSPFAQLLSTLQQLQQSKPTQYQQVTKQIATNLQNAAQKGQANGDTLGASQLTQLATDFSGASTSDQLPNIQDLAQAIGGGHDHHHRSHGTSSISFG